MQPIAGHLEAPSLIRAQSLHPSLLQITAGCVRRYIDSGADWSGLQDLPQHLFEEVQMVAPERTAPLTLMESNYNFHQHIFEMARGTDLAGTNWTFLMDDGSDGSDDSDDDYI
jgi:hypothetical protein